MRTKGNVREMLFCANYVENGGNITDAGVKAGYTHKYMDKRGSILLERQHIREEIRRLRGRIEKKIEKNAVDVVNQISKLAFAEDLDFTKPDPDHPGNYIGKSPEELTPEQRAAVQSFKCVPDYVRNADGDKVKPEVIKRYLYRYTLHDPQAALIQMGRHFGVFDDKLRITNGSGNRFANLTPEKLAELRTQIVQYMLAEAGEQPAIEGESSESPKMLSDDRGSGGRQGDPVGS